SGHMTQAEINTVSFLIAFTLTSLYFNTLHASRSAYNGHWLESGISLAWALIDIASLGLPLDPGAGLGGSVGELIAESAVAMGRVGLDLKTVWIYVESRVVALAIRTVSGAGGSSGGAGGGGPNPTHPGRWGRRPGGEMRERPGEYQRQVQRDFGDSHPPDPAMELEVDGRWF